MIRPIKIRHYLSAMKSRGFSAEAVLSGTGIDEESLTHPECLVDFTQCQTVISNMIKLTDNQGIGFEIGRDTRLMNLGIVAYAMMSSSNVRKAVQMWVEYSNSLLGLLLRYQLEEKRRDNWCLRVWESTPLGFIYNFCVEESLMMFMGAGTSLLGETPVITKLTFSFPAPAHIAQYHRHFDCPIEFNAAHTIFSFVTPDLEKPLNRDEAEFNELIVAYCNRTRRRLDRRPTVSKVRGLLLKMGRDLPDQSDAAKALGMSTRTLRRRLSQEGYSYQGVVSEFRFDMAREYLRSSSMGVKEIAFLLGYKDVNAFRRAFKSWTGKTVKDFIVGLSH